MNQLHFTGRADLQSSLLRLRIDEALGNVPRDYRRQLEEAHKVIALEAALKEPATARDCP